MTTFVVHNDMVLVKARNPEPFRDAAASLGAKWNPQTMSFEFPVSKDADFRRVMFKFIIDFAAQHGLI